MEKQIPRPSRGDPPIDWIAWLQYVMRNLIKGAQAVGCPPHVITGVCRQMASEWATKEGKR